MNPIVSFAPSRRGLASFLLAGSLWLIACGDDASPMAPGTACLDCHGGGEASPPPRTFSAAGTVYSDPEGTRGASGVLVTITDARGAQATLQTNALGNFFTTTPLTPPLEATLSYANGVVKVMPEPVAHGNCNGCHYPGGPANAWLNVAPPGEQAAPSGPPDA